ncbi:YchJ family protein [Colwelliaceae bacterium BS250]
MKCPCGSDKDFSSCCQPFINKQQLPKTAEQLMRSRYSAYAIKDSEYIFQTYAMSKQPDNAINDIKEWAEQTTWLTLEILPTDPESTFESAKDNEQQYYYVEFCADYLTNNEVWQMHEYSRFIIEDAQLKYLDGEVKHNKLLRTVTRNDTCPCGSARKYKRCCQK